MDPIVYALAYERDGYLRAGKAGRVVLVDNELARHGYTVSAGGELVELSEMKAKPAKKATAKRTAPKEDAALESPPETTAG